MIFEKFSLDSNDITITGTITKPSSFNLPLNLIVICHGIPSQDGKNLTVEEKGYLKISEVFSSNGFLSVVFNFQGCKGSTGIYSPINWINNLNSIITFMHSKYDILKTFVLSFSGGAMISVKTTAENPLIDYLITCACPADLDPNNNFIFLLRDGLLLQFSEQNLNKDVLLKELNEINPLIWVDKIGPREILILHGKNDELIPYNQSEKLYKLAKNPKSIYIFDELGHKLRRENEVIEFVLNWSKKKVS